MNRKTDYQVKQSTGPKPILVLAYALIMFGTVGLLVIVLGIVARSEPPASQQARRNVTWDVRLDGQVDRVPPVVEASNPDVRPHCLNGCWWQGNPTIGNVGGGL